MTLSVLMYDETGKNSATVNYYLNPVSYTHLYDRIVKSGKLLIVCDGIDDESRLYMG